MKDLVLTPPLVRAGRALLDWQQTELADKAHLSLTAVKNFEGGVKRTHPHTAAAIQDALESHGVEFPPTGGVRLVSDIAQTYRFTGPDFIFKWNEELMAAVKNPSEGILTSSTDENWWYHPSVRAGNIQFNEWREKKQIRIKSLIPEGHKTYNLPRDSYRTLPHDMLGKITYSIYADRIAIVIWKKKQVVVLRNELVAQTFRNQFLYLWRRAKPVGG